MKYLLTPLFVLFLFAGYGQITLEEVWQKGTFRTERVPGFNFLNDGQHYTRLINNQIVKFDLTTGEQVATIFDGSSIDSTFKIAGYSFSPNEEIIMLESNKKRIFRRSYTSKYTMLDVKSGQQTPIANGDKISYATLDPTGTKVAYVKNNNLYYQNLDDRSIIEVTSDGKKNEIINGHTDWVYEEEFGFVKAFYWSPDGKHLAFIRFDESKVREFTMTLHRDEQYPIYQTFKYPKVGEDNAVVSAHIYSVSNKKTITAQIGNTDDIYIPRMMWHPGDKGLCVFKMNRHQNELTIFLTDPEDGKSDIMLEEKNKYYIDIHDNLTFVEDGKCFIWTSEKDGYNHLYLRTINNKEKRQITNGNWEVTSFYGYDKQHDRLYYQSTQPGSMQRAIYRTNLKGNKKEVVANKRGFNSAQFSSTYDYYVLQHSDHDTPPTYNVLDANHQLVRPLVDNKKAKEQVMSQAVADVSLKEIVVAPGVTLNAALIKPKNFDPSKKYPLLMYQYGGPGSQQVMDRWNSFRYYWWFQYLAQEGYIVAVVDNRGTGGKGEEFKKMTYLQLGKYETEDQIAAARFFGQQDYIDEERIGIFGWSYGGYMSTLCILKGNDVFKSAIAVAPVTSWKWYDSVYTERYMRTLAENMSGYKDNSPVYFADRLKGNYLLVHGMADDNVHLQNAAEMAAALVRANKQFDTYFYPNKNHGIYGGNTRLHLFTKITDFVKNKI